MICSLLLLGCVLLTHLLFARSNVLLTVLVYAALFALYLSVTLAYFRREQRRYDDDIEKKIELLMNDRQLPQEDDLNDSALLRLAYYLRENERSMKIANSYAFHELRNRIAMTTSKLQAGYPTDKLLESFSDLNHSVEDLLALSALRSGTWENIDLALVCAMVADDYRKKCPGVRFLFEDSVSPVRGRTSLAYSAISNLVDNAIKYGSGTVDIAIREEGGSVIVSVENTGAVLTREQVDGLFRFQKRMNPLKKDGYGIGLSLVKNVAEVFGGFVWVSCREKTTRFYFSAPAC